MNQTADELKVRKILLEGVLQLMRTDDYFLGDERTPDAIAHYEAQLAQVAERLDELEKPEPIVIGLQPARMFGKVGG